MSKVIGERTKGHNALERACPSLRAVFAAAVRRLVVISSIACLCGLVVLAAVSATAEAACPNAAFRTGPSASLPECRAYEMVSPEYKGGYGAIRIMGVRSDGDAVDYDSPGVFAGAPAGFSEGLDLSAYIATRGPSGWSTSAELVPAALSPTVIGPPDFYSTLDRLLAVVQLPDLEEPLLLGNRDQFFIHATGSADTVSSWEPVGVTLEATSKAPNLVLGYLGASSDFCHVLFNSTEPLLPEAELSASAQLYEMASGCNEESPELRLVSLNQNHKPISSTCPPSLGVENGETGREDAFNAIADEGREVFFTSCIGANLGDHQLFLRLDGARTVEVSKPLSSVQEKCGEEVPCKSAATRASGEFAGASEDGSLVYFMSKAPLTGESDTSRNLYLATIGCSEAEPECASAESTVTSLTRVSRDVNAGEPADVQGVVRTSPDGSRVYFVARGVLSGESNAEGTAAVSGADNLYMYERDQSNPAGRIVFVTDLCSGANASGEVEDGHCPSSKGDAELWTYGYAEAQTAGSDGRFLVFSSYGQLTAGDTDSARDIYRYDGETGMLERVSIGEGGYDSDGNNSQYDARLSEGREGGPVSQQYELEKRAISEDGSRIVFTTSESLSPRAINGLSNAYEWHQLPGQTSGEVGLISGGSSETPVTDVVISPSGSDIFFDTTEGLVPQDTDGVPDVYDARIDGGFPGPPSSPQQCSSDACQGPLTNPAPLLVPGSVVQAPEGNVAPPPPPRHAVVAKPKRAKRRSGRRRKRTHVARRRSPVRHATVLMRGRA